MSFSYEQIEKLNLQRTPSPGGDYESLLNDSSTHKYSTEEFENIRDYSPIHPNGEIHSEISKLRAENEMLKAKIDIIMKEKELHVISNAKEKSKNARSIKNLKDSMEAEINKIKFECQKIMEKNKELAAKKTKIQGEKSEKLEFLKKQLERQEEHYQILIKDKDRVINALKRELRTRSSGKVTSKVRGVSSRKSSSTVSTVFTSPIPSNLGFYQNPKQKLDEISQLIVQLEKEQAELKESANDLEYNSEVSYQFKSLKDISDNNQLELKKVRTQPKLNFKNRLSSHF